MDDEVLLQVLQSLEDKLMETSAAEAAKESLDTVLCRAVNKQLSVSDSSPKSAVRVQGERSQAKSDPLSRQEICAQATFHGIMERRSGSKDFRFGASHTCQLA